MIYFLKIMHYHLANISIWNENFIINWTDYRWEREREREMKNKLTNLNQCLPKCNIKQFVLQMQQMEVLIGRSASWSWDYLRVKLTTLLTSHPEIPGISVTSSPCPNMGFTVIWKYGGSAKHILTRLINGHCRRNLTPTRIYRKKSKFMSKDNGSDKFSFLFPHNLFLLSLS